MLKNKQNTSNGCSYDIVFNSKPTKQKPPVPPKPNRYVNKFKANNLPNLQNLKVIHTEVNSVLRNELDENKVHSIFNRCCRNGQIQHINNIANYYIKSNRYTELIDMINKKDKYSKNCLINTIIKCYSNLTEVVKILINMGADTHSLTNKKRNSLFYACARKSVYNRLEVIKILLYNNVDPNVLTVDNTSSLTVLLRQSNVTLQEVELITSHNKCINVLDNFKQTPLIVSMMHKYCSVPRTKIVKILLEHGADPTLHHPHGLKPSELIKSDSCDRDELLSLLEGTKRWSCMFGMNSKVTKKWSSLFHLETNNDTDYEEYDISNLLI